MVICVLYDMIKRWIKKREKKDLPAIVVDVIHKLNNELDSVFPSVAFGIDHFAVNEKDRIKQWRLSSFVEATLSTIKPFGVSSEIHNVMMI